MSAGWMSCKPLDFCTHMAGWMERENFPYSPLPFVLSKQGIPREILQSISVQFLFFHPSILEPNFNLSICEVQHPGQLKSFLFVYVHVEEKLPFQFSYLVLGVRASLFPRSLGNH